MRLSLISILLIILSGCAASRHEQLALEQAYINSKTGKNVPGVQTFAWEEPMVDVVEVPAGLDPQGIYYRPQHEQIVEIRQGRWQYAPDARR